MKTRKSKPSPAKSEEPKTQRASSPRKAKDTQDSTTQGSTTKQKQSSRNKSPQTEPKRTRSPKSEPKTTYTPKTEPKRTRSLRSEPKTTDTPKTEQKRTRSPKTEPKRTRSPKPEQKTTTTPKTEPPKTRKVEKPRAVERKRISVNRKRSKVVKVVETEEVPQPSNLRECIERLNDTKYLASLPFREEQVIEICDFIEQCVAKSAKWQVLLLSGSPGTGKTATVQRCIEMAPKMSEITFVNCKTDKVRLIDNDEIRTQKILVLDEIESLGNFQEVLVNSRNHKCSIIGISNSHDRTLAAVSQGQNEMKSMIFNSYTTQQLQEIMWERLGGKNEHIQAEVIEYIAKSIGKDKGDARGILSCLNFVLCEAVRADLEYVDLKTAVKFLQKRGNKERSGSMGDVTLIDQLALVAVIKGGKKWKETFLKYAKTKHISVSCSLDDIFDRLVSYGFISDNKKNPCCIMDKAQFANDLDESVAILL